MEGNLRYYTTYYDRGRNTLYLGSTDGKIEVRDANLQVKATIDSHVGYVDSLAVVTDILVSGASDKNLCLHDIQTFQIIAKI